MIVFSALQLAERRAVDEYGVAVMAQPVFLTDALRYMGGATTRVMIDNTHVVVLRGSGRDMVPVRLWPLRFCWPAAVSRYRCWAFQRDHFRACFRQCSLQ